MKEEARLYSNAEVQTMRRADALRAALLGIREKFGDELPLKQDDQTMLSFYLYLDAPSPVSFEGIVSWNQERQSIAAHVMLDDVRIVPTKGVAPVCRSLNRILNAFLFGRFDGPGTLRILRDDEGIMTPCHGAALSNAGNDEFLIENFVSNVLVRSAFALSLCYPVVHLMMVEQRIPAPDERMKLLLERYGSSEVTGFMRDTPPNEIHPPLGTGKTMFLHQ